MNDAIKIIFKYKNNNRRTQYQIYIFVGDVSNNILKVLKKIQDLSFYDTFINLTKEEIKLKEFAQEYNNYCRESKPKLD